MRDNQLSWSKRVVERKRGCWNCVHWDNGETAKKRYSDLVGGEKEAILLDAAPDLRRIAVDGNLTMREIANKAKEFVKKGHTPEHAAELAFAALGPAAEPVAKQLVNARQQMVRYSMFDHAAATGQIGICKCSAAKADFVSAAYLCEQWTAAQGASVAVAGESLDKLPEELKDEE